MRELSEEKKGRDEKVKLPKIGREEEGEWFKSIA